MLSARELVRKLKECKEEEEKGEIYEAIEKNYMGTSGWDWRAGREGERKKVQIQTQLNQERVTVRSSMAEGLLYEDGSVQVQRSRGRLREGPLSWSSALQAVESHNLQLTEERGPVLSLQAAYALLAGRGGRHLEGEQMKKDRKGLDNAKRGGSEKDKWRLRLFRARRDLSRAGYKVQDIKEKHYVVDNSCQADHEEGCRQTKDVENIFATPLFGTRIGNILDYGEKEDVEKIVRTVVSDMIEHVVEEVGEQVFVDKGRKRSGELVGEEGDHPNKQPRIDVESNQRSPQYKAEDSEEEEEEGHEVVDIADEEDDEAGSEGGEEVMEVSDDEDEDLFLNPFHQSDSDEDDVEEVVAEEDEEVEVMREVAADPRIALERAASKKLEAVKRLVGRDLARLANREMKAQPGAAGPKETLGVFSCHDCKVSCSSQLTLDQHFFGRRHLRKVAQSKAKQQQNQQQLHQQQQQQQQQREPPQQLPVFECSLCDVTAPSQEV